MFGSVKVTAWY